MFLVVYRAKLSLVLRTQQCRKLKKKMMMMMKDDYDDDDEKSQMVLTVSSDLLVPVEPKRLLATY